MDSSQRFLGASTDEYSPLDCIRKKLLEMDVITNKKHGVLKSESVQEYRPIAKPHRGKTCLSDISTSLNNYMTIQETIEKAIDGGFSTVDGRAPTKEERPTIARLEIKTHGSIEAIFLNPLFWQSLGKAMGWPEDTTYCDHCGEADIADEYVTNDEEHSDCSNLLTFPKYWRYQWHRFIDHLADGATPESFFKQL